MSELVERAIAAAGLTEVLGARHGGKLDARHEERLRGADLLAVGALADRVREDEAGREVRIYADTWRDPPGDGPIAVFPRESDGATGLEMLRAIAIARVCGPRAGRVRVDWSQCGLELAQIALGFGANELVGTLANKLGLPLASGELLGTGKKSGRLPAQLVKARELATYVARAGRVPVFVGTDRIGQKPQAQETIG